MALAAVNKAPEAEKEEIRLIGDIPVRNLWLLMLYASRLFRSHGSDEVATEDNPDDIPDLVAEILCRQVQRRIQRKPEL